jgi:hypothetical protein
MNRLRQGFVDLIVLLLQLVVVVLGCFLTHFSGSVGFERWFLGLDASMVPESVAVVL